MIPAVLPVVVILCFLKIASRFVSPVNLVSVQGTISIMLFIMLTIIFRVPAKYCYKASLRRPLQLKNATQP